MNIKNKFNVKGFIIFLCTLLTCTFLMSMLTPKEVSAAAIIYDTKEIGINGDTIKISGPSVKRAIPDADWLKATAVQGSMGDTYTLTVSSATNVRTSTGIRTAKVYLYDANNGGNLVKVYTINQTCYKTTHNCTANGYQRVQDATCQTKSEYVAYCITCSKELDSYYGDYGQHNMTSWHTTKEPTCSSEGEKISVCITSCCTHQIIDPIKKLNHTPSKKYKTITDPTCTKVGKEVDVCTKCGEVCDERDIPQNGHDIRIVTNSEGLKYEKCLNCDYKVNPVKIISQPQDGYFYLGSQAYTSVSATGKGLSYKWEVKEPGSTKWGPSKITSSKYSYEMINSKDGRQVRCTITDGFGNEITTRAATLKSKVEIISQPKNASGFIGEDVKTIVYATGKNFSDTNKLKYTWYVMDPGDKDYCQSGIKTATYSFKMAKNKNGRKVYCIITDANGKQAKSNIATFTIPNHEHTFNTKISKEATCIKTGELITECELCGFIKETKTIPKTNIHKYDTNSRYELKDKKLYRECLTCDYSYSVGYDQYLTLEGKNNSTETFCEYLEKRGYTDLSNQYRNAGENPNIFFYYHKKDPYNHESAFMKEPIWMIGFLSITTSSYALDNSILIKVSTPEEFIDSWNNLTPKNVKNIHMYFHGQAEQLCFDGTELTVSGINNSLYWKNVTDYLYLYSCYGGAHANTINKSCLMAFRNKCNAKSTIGCVNSGVNYTGSFKKICEEWDSLSETWNNLLQFKEDYITHHYYPVRNNDDTDKGFWVYIDQDKNMCKSDLFFVPDLDPMIYYCFPTIW